MEYIYYNAARNDMVATKAQLPFLYIIIIFFRM